MHTILIVDDSPEMHRLYRATLQRPGYRLLTATSGSQALLAMGMQFPDVILLDMAMPEMDGVAFLKVLRQQPEWRHIPVIIITAFGTSERLPAMDQYDVAAHFVKAGFSVKQLRAQVDACLSVMPDTAAESVAA